MKWMEIIRLRVAVDQLERVGPQLDRLLAGLGEVTSLKKVTTYVGLSSPGDMGLTLHWDTDADPPTFGSPLAQSLVPTCRKFGLVDHSVWIEANHDSHQSKFEGRPSTGPDAGADDGPIDMKSPRGARGI